MIVQSQKNGHYLSFDEEKHKYILDGERVPGVTTFIHSGYPTSQALISWMKSKTGNAVFDAILSSQGGGYYPSVTFPLSKKEREEIIKEAKKADKKASEDAANIGTLTHDFAFYTEIGNVLKIAEVEAQIESHIDKDKILGCVNQFKEWRSTNQDEMVASEAIVASTQLHAAGKFDRLSRRNGKLILSDFKTSSAMYLEQMIQMAAYAVMIEEWMDLKVEGLEVLRFGKDDAEFQTLLVDKPEEIQIFKNQAIRCRETYEFTKMGEDKRWAFGGKSKKK